MWRYGRRQGERNQAHANAETVKMEYSRDQVETATMEPMSYGYPDEWRY